MKNFAPLKSLMVVGLVAGLMGSAANASMADYTQMLDSVKSGLASIQVDTSQLGELTVDELGKLNGILDSNDTNENKAMAANLVIDQAIMPTTLDMNSDIGKQLKAELKTNLARVGLTYPVNAMNIDQVNHLLAAFHRFSKHDDRAKQAVEGIYASMTNPSAVTSASSNEGLVQQQDQINVKLGSLGITPPAALTQEQVAKLSGIFDNGEPEANQKAAAMVVLGM